MYHHSKLSITRFSIKWKNSINVNIISICLLQTKICVLKKCMWWNCAVNMCAEVPNMVYIIVTLLFWYQWAMMTNLTFSIVNMSFMHTHIFWLCGSLLFWAKLERMKEKFFWRQTPSSVECLLLGSVCARHSSHTKSFFDFSYSATYCAPGPPSSYYFILGFIIP